ncbi:MAG: calcium/sodium antiporter [Candidatus Marinimicrobia bacterium]|nr:calcium/sodium antiporter [Candidatus Neomarinimicrobiota bacterium]
MYILYLIAGLFCLYYGAEYLVRGSSAIAYTFGMKKIVVGLTVVAMGTSMPEFVVSLNSAITGADSVSIGNIVGSNLANILLVLGLTGLINPVSAQKSTLFIDIPFLIFITLLFIFFCFDGMLTAGDSIILLIIFIGYMVYQIINRKDKTIPEPDSDNIEKGHFLKNGLFSIGGIVGLILGGNLTVKGAVDLAHILGVSDLIIGLTVVAVGTSLPELFTSVIAALRHEHEISLGNVIGSNLFNIAFVLGLVPLISPIEISQELIRFDNWFMLGITILMAVFVFHKRQLTRWQGAVLVLLYGLYVMNLIFNLI